MRHLEKPARESGQGVNTIMHIMFGVRTLLLAPGVTVSDVPSLYSEYICSARYLLLMVQYDAVKQGEKKSSADL